MKYIIKRNINLFGRNNIIKFGYIVKINNSKNGFENTTSAEAHRLAHAFVLDLPSEGALV